MQQFICNLDDIPLDGVFRFNLQDLPCLVYREGECVFACEAICPHMGGPLSEGIIDQGCVTCPWHGWRFDLKSGHCENVDSQQLRQIDLIVEGRRVYANLEPEVIPPLP